MSYASLTVMFNASSYNCMPDENYRVEGRYDHFSMESVGLDCLLNFSVCSKTINYSATFLFPLWTLCVVLNFNTNDYHLNGKKRTIKSNPWQF